MKVLSLVAVLLAVALAVSAEEQVVKQDGVDKILSAIADADAKAESRHKTEIALQMRRLQDDVEVTYYKVPFQLTTEKLFAFVASSVSCIVATLFFGFIHVSCKNRKKRTFLNNFYRWLSVIKHCCVNRKAVVLLSPFLILLTAVAVDMAFVNPIIVDRIVGGMQALNASDLKELDPKAAKDGVVFDFLKQGLGNVRQAIISYLGNDPITAGNTAFSAICVVVAYWCFVCNWRLFEAEFRVYSDAVVNYQVSVQSTNSGALNLLPVLFGGAVSTYGLSYVGVAQQLFLYLFSYGGDKARLLTMLAVVAMFCFTWTWYWSATVTAVLCDNLQVKTKRLAATNAEFVRRLSDLVKEFEDQANANDEDD